MFEREVWAFIKKQEVNNKNARWMRCENAVSTGVPDINACVQGHEFWIEVKCPKQHKRSDTPFFGSSHKLSAIQRSWMRRQKAAGGYSFLLACNESNTLLLDGGCLPSDLDKLTTAELSSHQSCVFYSASPIAEVWAELQQNLLNHLQQNQ